MSDATSGNAGQSQVSGEPGHEPVTLETLDEAECLRLTSPGGIGRLAYPGRSGLAHHMTSEAERASVLASGVEPWPGGPREHAIRITPTRIAGRRLRRGQPRNDAPASG